MTSNHVYYPYIVLFGFDCLISIMPCSLVMSGHLHGGLKGRGGVSQASALEISSRSSGELHHITYLDTFDITSTQISHLETINTKCV